MSFFDRLRPYLARVIGTLVGFACVWLLAHFHVVVDSDAQEKIVELIVELIAIALLIREGTHTTVSKKINPADTASAHLAKAGKTDVEMMKTSEREAQRAQQR